MMLETVRYRSKGTKSGSRMLVWYRTPFVSMNIHTPHTEYCFSTKHFFSQMIPTSEEERHLVSFLAADLLSILEDPWDWAAISAKGFLFFSPRQAAGIKFQLVVM